MTVEGEVCVRQLPGVVAGGEQTRLLGVLGQVLPVNIAWGEESGPVLVILPEHAPVQEAVLGGRHHEVVCRVLVVNDVFKLDSMGFLQLFKELLVILFLDTTNFIDVCLVF